MGRLKWLANSAKQNLSFESIFCKHISEWKRNSWTVKGSENVPSFYEYSKLICWKSHPKQLSLKCMSPFSICVKVTADISCSHTHQILKKDIFNSCLIRGKFMWSKYSFAYWGLWVLRIIWNTDYEYKSQTL